MGYIPFMRALIASFILFLFPSLAKADQFDPGLSELFEELRAGDGDVERLRQDIETIWLTAPEAGLNVLVSRVLSAMEAEEFSSARILIDHINGLAPHFAEGWVMKGHLALMLDDPIEAELAYARAVSLESRHYNALEKLGDLALAAGNEPLAHKRYREALNWNPHQSELRERADRVRASLGGQEI